MYPLIDPTFTHAPQIRPPNQRELDGGAKNIIVHAETSKRIRLDNVEKAAPYFFEYDEAIGADNTQEQVVVGRMLSTDFLGWSG